MYYNLSRNKICKKVESDVWGDLLSRRPSNIRLYRAIYRKSKRPRVREYITRHKFVLRIDAMRPAVYRKRRTAYYWRMIEARKMRYMYGDFPEYIFKRVFTLYTRFLSDPNHALLQDFESRLIITLFRTGLVESVFKAKQLIVHGKVKVNDYIVRDQHCRLKPGDYVALVDKKYLAPKFWFKRRGFRMLTAGHYLVSYKLRSFIYVDHFLYHEYVRTKKFGLFVQVDFGKVLNYYKSL